MLNCEIETNSPERIDSPAGDLLEIPPFNRLGHLPPGIHYACFETVIQRFATNAARKALFKRLEQFLLMVIDSNRYSHAYLGGDLTTALNSPKEIDVILQTQDSYGLHAFRAIEPLMDMGLDTIHKKYAVRLHFWCRGIPAENDDSQDYSGSICFTESLPLSTRTGAERGIVGIEL